jgi:hypothetical protein
VAQIGERGKMILPIQDHVSNLFGNDSRIRNFLSSDITWPLLLKGGFENTIRDLLVCDLQQLMQDKIVTGERHRFDIAIYNTNQGFSAIDLRNPIQVIEMKANFHTQISDIKTRMPRAIQEARERTQSNTEIFGLNIIVNTSISNNDNRSRLLLRRYRADTENFTQDINYLSQGHQELNVSPITCENNSGSIAKIHLHWFTPQ